MSELITAILDFKNNRRHDMLIYDLIINKNVNYLNIKDQLGCTALHFACLKGYIEIVRLLIYRGVDLDIKNGIGDTGLNYSSKYNFPKTVKLLLDAGADPNIKNKNNKTALNFASENGNTEVVKYLIESGAELDNQDKYKKQTPLYAASKDGYIEIIKLLIKTGANAKLKNNEGYLPIEITISPKIKEYLRPYSYPLVKKAVKKNT